MTNPQWPECINIKWLPRTGEKLRRVALFKFCSSISPHSIVKDIFHSLRVKFIRRRPTLLRCFYNHSACCFIVWMVCVNSSVIWHLIMRHPSCCIQPRDDEMSFDSDGGGGGQHNNDMSLCNNNNHHNHHIQQQQQIILSRSREMENNQFRSLSGCWAIKKFMLRFVKF